MPKKKDPSNDLDHANKLLTDTLRTNSLTAGDAEATRELRTAIYHLTLCRLWHVCPEAMSHARQVQGTSSPPLRTIPLPTPQVDQIIKSARSA